jgi:hypothetical protein
MTITRYLPALAAAALVSVATPVLAQEWIMACPEGTSRCTIDGTRLIRYGANGAFTYAVATNIFICSSETFGEPGPRGRKACWYRETGREQSLAAAVEERDRQVRQLRSRTASLEGELTGLRAESAELRAELDDVYAELDRIYSRELRRAPPARGPRWRDRQGQPRR